MNLKTEPLKVIKIYKTEEEFFAGPLGKYVWIGYGRPQDHNEIRLKARNTWNLIEARNGKVYYENLDNKITYKKFTI